MLLAIDPGADSGWAIFFQDVLVGCGLGATPKPLDGLKTVVIEHPVIYPGGRTANPNDVMKVAINAGEWAGRFRSTGAEIRYVTPREWKGTIDGDLKSLSILRGLSPENYQFFVDAVRDQKLTRGGKILNEKGKLIGKLHNVVDAIGIGLFAMRRR